jgi:hypothetical protein
MRATNPARINPAVTPTAMVATVLQSMPLSLPPGQQL